MKKAKLAAATALAAVFAVGAVGFSGSGSQKNLPRKEIYARACTLDTRWANFLVYIDRDYLKENPDFEARVIKTFTETANISTAEELNGKYADVGGARFYSSPNLTDEEAWMIHKALTDISVTVPGQCKPPPRPAPSNP